MNKKEFIYFLLNLKRIILCDVTNSKLNFKYSGCWIPKQAEGGKAPESK